MRSKIALRFTAAATAERLPDEQADVVVDEADGAVGQAALHATGMIAAGGGPKAVVRRASLHAGHAFARCIAAAPHAVGRRRIGSGLRAEDIRAHHAVSPGASCVLKRRADGTLEAIFQLTEGERIGKAIRNVLAAETQIGGKYAADRRVAAKCLAIGAAAVAGGEIAAGEVLHAGAVFQGLIIERMRR